ncbi:PREDICTED: uncharacterized protein LOC109151131 [Ipomoea nil]|uniref:uncharacterized protein LOC109151131 n=1 Tax=Ipomoea nil TaxID=35883 RepID=UPI00090129C1|nr:PREDICTED: uncharacterized protein LOC109151131 [Ipomoea nil]
MWMKSSGALLDSTALQTRHQRPVGRMETGFREWRFTGFGRHKSSPLGSYGQWNQVGLDFGFSGYQYTWERSKGTHLWVEAKLDRVLTSDSWSDLFPMAKAESITTAKSDHMPLLLQSLPRAPPIHNTGFRFENLWLREAHCRNIMIESWSNTHGHSLMDRVGICGTAIWIWGKHFARNFQRCLDHWRKRMEATKYRRDPYGITLFKEAQSEYLRVLQHQSDYWRQRAKQFWLKDGDTNSSFFHKTVKRRQQAN